MVFHGPVAAGAVQPLGHVVVAPEPGGPFGRGGMAGIAGVRAATGHVGGVPAVDGGGHVGRHGLAGRLFARLGSRRTRLVARPADHGGAGPGPFGQVGAVDAVVHFQHVGGGGRGNARHAAHLPFTAVTVAAAHLGGHRQHAAGDGQQRTGGVARLHGYRGVRVEPVLSIGTSIRQHGNARGLVQGGAFHQLQFTGKLRDFRLRGGIGRLRGRRGGGLPGGGERRIGHGGGPRDRRFGLAVQPPGQGRALGHRLRAGAAMHQLRPQGGAGGQQGPGGFRVGHVLHALPAPRHQHIRVLAGVEGGHVGDQLPVTGASPCPIPCLRSRGGLAGSGLARHRRFGGGPHGRREQLRAQKAHREHGHHDQPHAEQVLGQAGVGLAHRRISLRRCCRKITNTYSGGLGAVSK